MKNIKGSKIIEYTIEIILVVFFIISTGSVWRHTPGNILYDRFNEIQIAMGLLMLLYSIYFVSKRKYTICHSELYWVIVVVVCMFLVFINSSSNLLYSIKLFFLPAVACVFLGLYMPRDRFESVIFCFVFIMTAIGFISLVFWTLGSCLGIISPSGTVVFDWDILRRGNNYYNIYYESPMMRYNLFGLSTYRNTGIFTEAPMFSFLLSSAYCLIRTISNKTHIFINTILLLSIVSSISTTGIVAILIFEGINMINKKGKSNIANIILVVTKLSLLVIIPILAYKLIYTKMDSSSGTVRSDHFLAALSVIKEKVLFGTGLGNTQAIMSRFYYQQGNSIGVPYLFAQTGLGGIIIVFLPIVKNIISSLRNGYRIEFAFSIVWIWNILLTTLFLKTPFVWFITMYMFRGLSSRQGEIKEINYNLNRHTYLEHA